jgi:hypothetical protein
MPAHRTGRAAFLGRVPDLDELQVHRSVGALGQVRQRPLREHLNLPPPQARQRQNAQKSGGRTTGRQQVPLPETPQPDREIVLTIIEAPDIFHQEPFEVHAMQVTFEAWLRKTLGFASDLVVAARASTKHPRDPEEILANRRVADAASLASPAVLYSQTTSTLLDP